MPSIGSQSTSVFSVTIGFQRYHVLMKIVPSIICHMAVNGRCDRADYRSCQTASFNLLRDGMPVGDVLVLSESENEGENLIPEPPPAAKPPRKKRRGQRGLLPAPAKNVVEPAAKLQVVLGSRCKCKSQDCLRLFAGKEDFQALLKYRTAYFYLHKLGQDHFALRTGFGI